MSCRVEKEHTYKDLSRDIKREACIVIRSANAPSALQESEGISKCRNLQPMIVSSIDGTPTSKKTSLRDKSTKHGTLREAKSLDMALGMIGLGHLHRAICNVSSILHHTLDQ